MDRDRGYGDRDRHRRRYPFTPVPAVTNMTDLQITQHDMFQKPRIVSAEFAGLHRPQELPVTGRPLALAVRLLVQDSISLRLG